MIYSKLNTSHDKRKPKDVLFSDTYTDGTEKDVLLRFLNKYDDRDEIDIDDISKLIAISALNVKYKLRGKGIKHYLNPRTVDGRLRRTINRASIAQIKEIIHDRTINKEFRGELLEFLDDRVNPSSPNYGIPFNLNDNCTWDDYDFKEEFSDCKIKDLFRLGLTRGIIRVPTKEEYLNNLLRSHNLPYRVSCTGKGNKPIFKVYEVKPELMVIKIYR